MIEELKDNRGVVWSEIYHNKSKKMSKNGRWKAKSGISRKDREAYEISFMVQEPVEFKEVKLIEETPEPVQEKGWYNASGSPLEIWGERWEVKETRSDISKDVEESKKFKHAVQLECLVKK